MNRRVFLYFAAVALGAAAASAQQAQQVKGAAAGHRLEAGPREAIYYEFKHLDPQKAASVAELAGELFNLNVRYDSGLNSVVLRGTLRPYDDWKTKSIEFLRKYDVPAPNEAQVNYVAYLIRASNKPLPARATPTPVPQDLNEALAEMKKALSYAHYDLVTTVSTVSQGNAESSDGLQITDIGGWAYDLRYSGVSVAPDRKSVSLHPFVFRLRPGATKQDVLATIESNITIREGQKLVLGKVHLYDDADLFVVLTAKVE
jgi:hypothetical protein